MSRDSRTLLVNALTFARAPLILAWLGLAVVQECAVATTVRGNLILIGLALLMLVLSALTDLWDGQLARKWGVVSKLGKMADPLMDKVFYLVVFPTLIWQIMHQGDSSAHALVMLFFTILYLIRDTWVNFLRMISAGCGADVAAMWLGKVRTALSFPGAGWIYAYCVFHVMVPAPWANAWLVSCLTVEAVLALLTVWSMAMYTRVYWPYFRKASSVG